VRGGLVKTWLASFLLIGALGTLWALSAPLGSGPDEGQHIVKAAAVYRGELIGTPVPSRSPAYVDFTVPRTFGLLAFYPDCYRATPPVPASCEGILKASSTQVATPTYTGRYPPLYYLLVGWPTLLSDTGTSVYLMRIISVLVSALFIGLAVALALTYAESLVVAGAVLLATTPAALYLSAVVEPNGLEFSSALLLWTALALLLGKERDKVPRSLVHAAGAAATVMALTRGLSVAWLAGILLVMLVVVAPPARVRAVFSSRAAKLWGLATVVASGLAVAWVATQGSLDVVALGNRRYTAFRAFGFVIGHTLRYLMQLFGSFNPRGTHIPIAAEPFFWAALALLVVWAVVRAGWRVRFAMLLVVAATVLAGPVLTAASIHADGIIWNGRYLLAAAVGLPVLAGVAVDGTALARRKAPSAVLVAVALGCQVVGIYALLRRFAVGTRGEMDILFAHVSWQPPLGVTLIAIGALAVTVLTATFVLLLAPRLLHRTPAAAQT
jgi:hypothetical protein